MKIKLDFVTNSSSTSFMIIGVNDKDIINKIMEAENVRLEDDDDYDNGTYVNESTGKDGKTLLDMNHGISPGEHVSFYGFYHTVCYAGVDAENLLEDKNLKEIRDDFKDMIKIELNVDIDVKDIDIHYGEVGDG